MPKYPNKPADQIPYLIEFMTNDGDDQWLRDQIRGLNTPPPQTHKVIVQGGREADRVITALANLKYARHKPYDGATYQRCDAIQED